jgi:hypothetical protein
MHHRYIDFIYDWFFQNGESKISRDYFSMHFFAFVHWSDVDENVTTKIFWNR